MLLRIERRVRAHLKTLRRNPATLSVAKELEMFILAAVSSLDDGLLVVPSALSHILGPEVFVVDGAVSLDCPNGR